MKSLYPLLCNYYITTRCNARCTFCNIHRHQGNDAVTDNVMTNLEDLHRLGISFIDFTGGEPLLHRDLTLFLQKAKSLRMRTTITTNTLLYPQKAKQLKGLIDFLHFSMDAPNAADHNAIRGVSCFDHVMQSIDIAKSIGEKPDLLYTITEENKHHLSEMISIAQKHRLILIVNPVFSYFGNENASIEMLKELQDHKHTPYVYINRGIIKFMIDGGNCIEKPRCRSVKTTIVISEDNYLLLPCYHHSQQKILIDGNLPELWKSQDVRKAESMQGRHTFCKNCSISCYFDPSFVHTIDQYFWLSQLSKVKYTFDKYIR
ncbi:radical SAM protein [bacterium]|nr:radical SAM protein [bacterium]